MAKLQAMGSRDAALEAGKTFRDYITEYQYNAKNDQIKRVSLVLGLDEIKLRNMMNAGLTEGNINEYGRLDDLKKTVDKEKAKDYFENILHEPIPVYRVNIKAQNLLEDFILKGGFEV
jgi:type I restriction enzyme R subunit